MVGADGTHRWKLYSRFWIGNSRYGARKCHFQGNNFILWKWVFDRSDGNEFATFILVDTHSHY